MQFNSVGVIGGGAWGSALAQTLRAAGRDVLLWAHEAATVEEINAEHTNTTFLPGIAMDPAIQATQDLQQIAGQDLIIMVPPAQHLRAISGGLADHLKDGTPVVICSKGIEQATGQLMGTVLAETLPKAQAAILSGPSFAAEIARGLPAAVTLACHDEPLGQALATAIGYRNFRIYWSDDLAGVQLGGAIKNVLAIAAGIVDGKGLGASAHAALVTRGFAELRRFGEVMSARPETLSGLSGLGDLLLTCGSRQSRNMSLGRGLGEGKTLHDILGARRSVSEGVFTAEAVVKIAGQNNLDLPICQAVHEIVSGATQVDDAIDTLLSRPFRAED